MANNSFWFANPSGFGGTTGPARAGYGDAPAVDQENSWANIMGKYPGLYSNGWGLGGGGGAASAWGSPAFAPGSNAGWAPTATVAPGAQLLQTAKSPAANSVLGGQIGQIGALSNNASQNVFTTTKDPATQTRIDAQGQTLDSGNTQANATLADFTRNYLAGDQQANQFQQQETGAIGRWYGPASDPNSIQGSLDRLVNQRRQAVQGALLRAMDRATRSGNLSRLGLGGNDSYRNQQFADTSAGILANEAAQEADLNRANFLNVANTQNAMAGTRAGLLNNYLSRDLVPIQAGQQLQASELGNLGALSNIQSGNRVYQTPEALLAARLGLVGQYGNDLNNLNIFGVGAQFPNVNLPPLGRGFNPNSYLPAQTSLYGNTYGNDGGMYPANPGAPGEIDPNTGMPYQIPPSQLAAYIAGSGWSPSPRYVSSQGTATGGTGDLQYVPGVGYVPNGGTIGDVDPSLYAGVA